MFFWRNVSEAGILAAEYTRLKMLYAKALETKNEEAIAWLRKLIKQLKAEMTIQSVCS
jgi:hypothetical protein